MSSSPPVVSSSNAGFKMLSKMGWKAGEGLGRDKGGLRAPIEVVAVEGRQGLGKREADDEALTSAASKRARFDFELPEDEQRRRQEDDFSRKSRSEDVRESLREFFCADCDKQYKTVAEFATHLSSYDHHHRKRFRDMAHAQRPKRDKDEQRKRREREEEDLQRRIHAAHQQDTTIPEEKDPSPATQNKVQFGFFNKKKKK